MSSRNMVFGFTLIIASVISFTLCHPVVIDLPDELIQQLQPDENLARIGEDFKRAGRMGWRKCNPLFNFRCGKKTVYSYNV